MPRTRGPHALNAALQDEGAAKVVGATSLVRVIDRWREAPDHLATELRLAVEEVCRQLGERHEMIITH